MDLKLGLFTAKPLQLFIFFCDFTVKFVLTHLSSSSSGLRRLGQLEFVLWKHLRQYTFIGANVWCNDI